MRNIPDFTCEHGAAQLILESLPYTGKAYVLVQWAFPGRLCGLLEECRRFCRMVDAQRVLALADTFGPEKETADFPTAFRVLSMQGEKAALPGKCAALFPVTGELMDTYLRLHNEAMRGIDGARHLSGQDKTALLQQGGCYFVHREETLLGLGQVDGNKILSIAACIPGEGATVLATLAEAIWADTLRLSVADTNVRAVRFYKKQGFITTGTEETWVELTNE